MPNQQNFPDPLIDGPNVRPRKIAAKDSVLIRKDETPEKEIVFGQTHRDNIEVYVYDELGNSVAHTVLRPNDEAVRLIALQKDKPVGIGQDQTPDVLQVDFKMVFQRFGVVDPDTGEKPGLPPGRYKISLNVLRDEVGREGGGVVRKMFVSDISPSRREIRLRPARNTRRITNEIAEFVEPSVPKFVAQAIVDQLYGVALEIIDEIDEAVRPINFNLFEEALSKIDAVNGTTGVFRTSTRINRAGIAPSVYDAFAGSIPLIRERVLDSLAANINDLQIRDVELQKFIREGVGKAMIEMVNTGKVDPKLQFIDRDGNPIEQSSTRLRTE